MTCDQCHSKMTLVGRQIKPGEPAVWVDGYVCPKFNCQGYGTVDHQGSESRWPGMTLMPEIPLHAGIRGAMKFRDASRL